MRMVVAYDGGGFHGFARQPGQRTVSGELARAISNFCRHNVELVCAGRTDSGVHAQGQVVQADVDPSVDPVALKRAINRQLSPEVVVRSLVAAPPGFDARHSASSRSYRYLVLRALEPDPLLAGIVWHVSDGASISGRCRQRPMRFWASTTSGRSAAGRRVTRRMRRSRGEFSTRAGERCCSGTRASDPARRLLRFDVCATSFCHQMVRSVVGVMVEIGRARMKPSDVPKLLASSDRAGAKVLAPPHGLCLMSVDYPSGSIGLSTEFDTQPP